MSLKDHLKIPVRVEVFDLKEPTRTLRLNIPAEALRALAENGIGQLYVGSDDEKLRESGVREVFVSVERMPIVGEPGLREVKSAFGEPKLDGVVIGYADSAWWPAREARHAMRRSETVERLLQHVSEPGWELHDLRRLLEEAFDAGSGRRRS